MRPVAIRRAQTFDAGAIATLLNTLPGRAGHPVDADMLRDWMADGDDWHVAERGGDLCGLQWIGPCSRLPPDTCEIATFMAPGEDGIAAGSALFEATRRAARARGFRRIVAAFGHGNGGARAYYRSRGFEAASGAAAAARLAAATGVNQVVTIYRV